jgi:hypothetical protein
MPKIWSRSSTLVEDQTKPKPESDKRMSTHTRTDISLSSHLLSHHNPTTPHNDSLYRFLLLFQARRQPCQARTSSGSLCKRVTSSGSLCKRVSYGILGVSRGCKTNHVKPSSDGSLCKRASTCPDLARDRQSLAGSSVGGSHGAHSLRMSGATPVINVPTPYATPH